MAVPERSQVVAFYRHNFDIIQMLHNKCYVFKFFPKMFGYIFWNVLKFLTQPDFKYCFLYRAVGISGLIKGLHNKCWKSYTVFITSGRWYQRPESNSRWLIKRPVTTTQILLWNYYIEMFCVWIICGETFVYINVFMCIHK